MCGVGNGGQAGRRDGGVSCMRVEFGACTDEVKELVERAQRHEHGPRQGEMRDCERYSRRSRAKKTEWLEDARLVGILKAGKLVDGGSLLDRAG